MASPLVIPFNNQPFIVASTSSSYTVPAGFYAKCLVTSTSGWIIVNGRAVSLASHSGFGLLSTSQLYTASYVTFYQIPLTRSYGSITWQITRTDGSSGTSTIACRVLSADGTTVKYSNSVSGIANGGTYVIGTFAAGPGDFLQGLVTNAGYNQNNTSIYTNAFTMDLAPYSLWLNAGDVISVDGGSGSIVYQQYKVVS